MDVTVQFLTAASFKWAVHWVAAPRSLVEVYRRFRGTFFRAIALIMEAASVSETSVDSYQPTGSKNSENSRLQMS
jgi:hypothetical protein